MTIALVSAAGAAAVGLFGIWFASRRRIEVPCTIELQATQDDFHAHVELEGVEVREGDEVLVHGAPSRIAHGEFRRVTSRATVGQATLPRRIWTRLVGASEISSLYEVGFEG